MRYRVMRQSEFGWTVIYETDEMLSAVQRREAELCKLGGVVEIVEFLSVLDAYRRAAAASGESRLAEKVAACGV